MIDSVVEWERYGASFFRLRLDPLEKVNLQWQPLFIDTLQLPDGPLPGKEDYKIKALAVIRLERDQRLYFRLRANDGVTMAIGHQRVFDEWRPIPMGIIADFTEKLAAGNNLLELDYYLGHNKGVLELQVMDAAGREVVIHPLDLELDVDLWQGLLKRQERSGRLKSLGLLLAFLSLLTPLAWLIVRNPWLPEAWLARFRPLAPGFGAGFILVLLGQTSIHVGTPANDDLLQLFLIPLAGGLLGAGLQAALFGLEGQRGQGLAQGLARLDGWRREHDDWITPLLIFGGLLLYMSWVVSWRGGSFPDSWLNAPWDAQQYKDIMARGYRLFRTETGAVGGNFPWHPLFPWLARVFYWLGLSRDWALLAMAWLSAAAAFVLLYRLARELFGASAARWSLAALACYPGSFYLLIGYPYGTAIALGAGYFLALRHERPWLACLLGFGLGMTYPTAVLVGLFALFKGVPRISQAQHPWPPTKAMLIAGAGPALGLLALCLHHGIRFDNFLLPITAHDNWKRRAEWPWDVIMDGVLHEPPQYPEAITVVLIVTAMVIFAHRFHPALWAYLIAVFLIGPATGSLESVYRQYLMAWPLFLLIGSSARSPWLKASFLWLMIYFSLTWLIPLWLTNDLV